MDSLISVIIPVYNVRHYLEACINSVLCQTYKRLEIILVDDGSTDGSQDICDNYASTYDMIEVIHQKNGGQSRARNAGLASANGEYISFIDSDDILHEQYYEIMLYMLDKFEADVAQCAFERFASEKELGKSVLDVDNIGAYRKQTARDAQRACFGEDSLMYSSASNKLYKRSAIGNNVFPEGRIYEDTYFVNKIYDGIRNMIVTEHKLYYYRYVADSTLHRKLTTKNFDICTLYEEFAKKYSDDEELLVLSRLHYKKCIEIMYIDAKEKGSDKEVTDYFYDKLCGIYQELTEGKLLNIGQKVKYFLLRRIRVLYHVSEKIRRLYVRVIRKIDKMKK